MAAGGSNTSNGGRSIEATDWTPHEESALEDLLEKYASESIPTLYYRIAQSFRSKTVRDIASRIIWMKREKEKGKGREEDIGSSRKNKGKKVEGSDALPESSQVANLVNGLLVMSVDRDSGDGFNAIDDPAGQILSNNARALDQISNNLSACKIDENIRLFTEARANINLIFKEFEKPEADINLILKELTLGDMADSMKRMPPLFDKLNDDPFSLEDLNTDANQIV